MSFGLQNSVIALTPTGRIDSRYADGADGSGVKPVWISASLPKLSSLFVGDTFLADLVDTGALIDPGSPSTELGFYTVSGTDPITAGFSYSGTTLQNSLLRSATGTFCLVGVRGEVSVLSDPISFSISSKVVGQDDIAPSIPTGITTAQGSAVGTFDLTFEPPSDIAPANAPASGVVHVNAYINGVLASPPSPIITPTNALSAPTDVNIGAISSPDTPVSSQSQKTWTLTAAGTGIAGTTAEQCLLVDFGTFSGNQRFTALLNAYTGSTTALMGLMIHETAVSGGKFVAIGLRPSNGTVGLYVETRTTSAGTSTQVATQVKDANGANIVGPVYVKIERAANVFTVSYSLTQVGWTVITSQTIAMNAAIHFGPFMTSQSAGTDAVGQVSEVSINISAAIKTTISSAVSVSLALQSIDANGNASAVSSAITCIPRPPVSQGSIVWLPGHIGRTGSGNSTGFGGSLATVLSFISAAVAADINNKLVGFCVPAVWANLEGPTAGVYDGSWAGGNAANSGFAGVQQLINLLKSFTPKRYLMISLNQTGNGSGANTNAAFPSSFAPSYLNSTLYEGGCEWGGRTGYSGYPNTNTTLWNVNTALRVTAMVKAYYDHFGAYDPVTGNGIYMWELTNEIALQTTSKISGAAFVNAIVNGYATIRTQCPKLMLSMRPTFVHPETAAGYGAIGQAMRDAKICMGNEDGSNNFMGTNPKACWSDQAYAGRGIAVGLTDYTQLNTWAHVFNVENAEYGRESAPLGAVPPANVGSGYILDNPSFPGIMSGANFLGSSHVIWFLDTQDGPNVNRFKFPVTSGQAPNPTPGPGAGLTTARPHLIDVITGNTGQPGIAGPLPITRTARPTGW